MIPLSQEYEDPADLKVAEAYYQTILQYYGPKVTDETARIFTRLGVNRARYGVVYAPELEKRMKIIDGRIK